MYDGLTGNGESGNGGHVAEVKGGKTKALESGITIFIALVSGGKKWPVPP